MKKIESFILRGCGYTALILTLIYVMTAILKIDGGIRIGRFFLVLAFGFVISATELLCKVLKFKRFLKIIILYAVLLLAFCLIFMLIDPILPTDTPAKVFVDIAVFTVFFAVVYSIAFLIGLMIKAVDGKIEKSKSAQTDNKTKLAKNEKSEYTPRFGSTNNKK